MIRTTTSSSRSMPGFSAYAAPLGMIEAGADTFAGQIPTILKLNSSNSLAPRTHRGPGDHRLGRGRAAAGLLGDRLHHLSGLGCGLDQMEEIRELRREEAKAAASPSVIWSYPRGGDLSQGGRDGDRHLRLCRAYGGAARRPYHQGEAADRPSRAGRGEEGLREGRASTSRHAGRARPPCRAVGFNGRRIVVFSGGAAKDLDGGLDEARAIRDGGGNGSIIGRNTFQRPQDDALAMLDEIIKIYQGKD